MRPGTRPAGHASGICHQNLVRVHVCLCMRTRIAGDGCVHASMQARHACKHATHKATSSTHQASAASSNSSSNSAPAASRPPSAAPAAHRRHRAARGRTACTCAGAWAQTGWARLQAHHLQRRAPVEAPVRRAALCSLAPTPLSSYAAPHVARTASWARCWSTSSSIRSLLSRSRASRTWTQRASWCTPWP